MHGLKKVAILRALTYLQLFIDSVGLSLMLKELSNKEKKSKEIYLGAITVILSFVIDFIKFVINKRSRCR